MNRCVLSIFACAMACFCLSTSAMADMKPTFSLSNCGWGATDIVVVQGNAKYDGHYVVLASWAGRLRPKERIYVPSMRFLQSTKERSLKSGLWRVPVKVLKVLKAQRLILFLRRRSHAKGTPVHKLRWRSAHKFGAMKVSFLASEKGRVYAVQQFMNPGPAVLLPVYDRARTPLTEAQIKSLVLALRGERKRLMALRGTKDVSKRAAALVPWAFHKRFITSQTAFQMLVKCGPKALPALQKMLDSKRTDMHGLVVRTMVQAGKHESIPLLVKELSRDLAFWRRKAPGLPKGWWNHLAVKPKERIILHTRFFKTLFVLQSLLSLRLNDARGHRTVRQIRDFWRSTPQLMKRHGLHRVSRVCDQILKLPKRE